MSSKPDGSILADFVLYKNPVVENVYLSPEEGGYLLKRFKFVDQPFFGFRTIKFPPGAKFDPAKVVTAPQSKLTPPSPDYERADLIVGRNVDPAKTYGKWDKVKGVPFNPHTDWGREDTEGRSLDTPDSLKKKFAFYSWLDSKAFFIGQMHVSNGMIGFTLANVFWRSATGLFAPVGEWEYIEDDNDAVFAFAISLAAMAAGAGWTVAFGTSFISGNTVGMITALAKSSLPVDTPASTEGVSMDDFDIPNEFSWDSFGFSDGESTVFYGDAEWADYGFGPVDYTGTYDSPVGLDTTGSAYDVDYSHEGYSFNGTPEVTTNTYGTVFEDVAKVAAPVASVAAKLAGTPSAPPPANKSTGAPLVPKPQTGTNDLLGTLNSVITTAGQGIGVMSQMNQMGQKSTYAGQLTPTGGASPGTIAGIPSTYLMIGGGVLLVLAIYMHSKG